MEVFILISIIIIIGITALVYISHKRRRMTDRDIDLIRRELKKIEESVNIEPRHGVVEADKLLDFVLKKRGYSGTLGEKLQHAEQEFKNANAVWSAHKLRNRIAHEVGLQVSAGEAQQAISSVKQALWDLGIPL